MHNLSKREERILKYGRDFGRCETCWAKITTLAAGGCSCGNSTNSVYHRCDDCALASNQCVICDGPIYGGNNESSTK